MAGWDEILQETAATPSQLDYVRRKYLKRMHELTGRNIITYYSSWLFKPGTFNVDINDQDIEGFMNAVKGMDCSLGLDLILHTPGGDPAAAEAIIQYLKAKFYKNIRVIVPQLAMSAGTMMACAAKEIVMGKQSSLGPIDPQIHGIPAYNIKQEFEEAKKDLQKNPSNAQYWAIKLQQYPAAFMKTALDAIELSGLLVKEWLGDSMYDKSKEVDKSLINIIVAHLNEHDASKSHARHFNFEYCQKIGLKIKMMEDDSDLQDAILSVHHAYIISLQQTTASKIIENNMGKAFISHAMQVNA
jgi:hypothetical protein